MDNSCPIQLLSYVRSGTMLTWELLGLNINDVPYGNKSIKGNHTHMIIEDAKEYGLYDKYKSSLKPTIYVLRDCRDVLVSAYKAMISNNKTKVSFSEFLRGDSGFEPSKKRYPIVGVRIAEQPIRNWIAHIEWVCESWVDTYKFEYIKDNQTIFIEKLKNKYNLELKNKFILEVNKPVGVLPGKGTAGSWKTYFSEEDHDYFWSIAGNKMIALGYSK